MRVLVDAIQYGPRITGTDRLAANVLMELLRGEHDLDLLVCVNASQTFVQDTLVDQCETVLLPGRGQARWLLNGLLEQGKGSRADVLLSFHNCVGPVYGALPSVVSLLDMLPFRQPDWYLQSRARAFASHTLARRVVQRASELVAISEFTAQDAVEVLRADVKRITVAPLGVEERFQPQSPADLSAVRTALGLPPSFVLTLGANDPRKNTAAVIAAHALLPDELRATFPLVVVGGSTQTPAPTEHVRVLAAVDDALLPALYAAASVFVFASSFEGFGLPLLEAMASGTPTLSARGTSLPEVGGAAVRYVDHGNVHDVSRALHDLLIEPASRHELTCAGRRRAAEFTWTRTAKQYADAIRRAGG